MVDQNTDRMWYVIGAVLIGASIIFASATMFPSAFASIGAPMENLLEVMDGYGANMLGEYSIYPHYVDIVNNYDKDGTVSFESTGPYDGIYLKLHDLGLKENTQYVLRYNLRKTDGDLYNIAGHTDAVFDSELLRGPDVYYVNNILMPFPYDLNYIGDDGEYVELMGDPVTYFLDNDFRDNLVEFYFTTDDNFEDDLMDASGKLQDEGRIYIQANRGIPETPVTVVISNLELVEVLRDDGQGGF